MAKLKGYSGLSSAGGTSGVTQTPSTTMVNEGTLLERRYLHEGGDWAFSDGGRCQKCLCPQEERATYLSRHPADAGKVARPQLYSDWSQGMDRALGARSMFILLSSSSSYDND